MNTNIYLASVNAVKTPDSKFTIVTSLEDISIILTIIISTSVILTVIVNLITKYLHLRNQIDGISITLKDYGKDIEELQRNSISLQRQIDRNTAARHGNDHP